MLVPKGGGVLASPVVIGAYGSDHEPLPRIDGDAATAAVWLADMSYVTVEDLQLTNAGDSTGLHRGVYFTSQHHMVRGITVRNLLIDDVDSSDAFSTAAQSGGAIVGQALGDTGRFQNVMIENNQIHDVSRQGITVFGTAQVDTRPPATRPWPEATTGLVIRGDTVTSVTGDGIIARGSVGAIVEDNVLREGNLAGYDFDSPNRRCAAGIFALDANNTLIQYNEVSGMLYGPSTTPGSLNGCDGEGFDIDGTQDGTIVQYNYSYDNAGGFILLCASGGTADDPNPPHHADVRFNLSVDDNATFNPSPCSGAFSPIVNNLNGVRFFNNTIVAPAPRVTLELQDTPVTGYFGTFLFQNNIVDATSPDADNEPFPCGTTCSHNLFFGMPTPPTATNSLTSNPMFVDPTRRGAGAGVAVAFRVQMGSPALHAGIPVPAGTLQLAEYDFFGNKISNPPTIGFSEK
jgi:hypothetical protein